MPWCGLVVVIRFHKKSAGIDIPELYKNRMNRDLEFMR